MIDLHQHSTCSDGTDTVLKIIKNNKSAGIEIMALTDHDTIKGCRKIIKTYNNKFGMSFIPGIEFSTQYEGESVHLVCLGYDIDDKIINNLVKKAKQLRYKRIAKRIELLKSEFGIEFSPQTLAKIKRSPNASKPMLGKFLLDMGYGSSIGENIQKYMYHKLPSEKLSTEEVIKAVKQSSGKIVYAHPLGGVGEKRIDKKVFEKRLKEFIGYGLQGIECYYSLYTPEEQSYLLEKAKEYKLLVSGGSDYHGTVKTVKIGELRSDGSNTKNNNLTIIKKVKNIYNI